MISFRHIMLVGALGAGLFAGGCSSLMGNDDDDDRRSSRSSRDYDYDRDARVSRGGRVERDSGTSRTLPRDARVVDEVRDGRMSYTARDSGQVYLYDSTAGTVVWDGRIRDGDRVTINPDKNRIEINGKEQADIDLKSNHRFELYSTDAGSRSRSSRY